MPEGHVLIAQLEGLGYWSAVFSSLKGTFDRTIVVGLLAVGRRRATSLVDAPFRGGVGFHPNPALRAGLYGQAFQARNAIWEKAQLQNAQARDVNDACQAKQKGTETGEAGDETTRCRDVPRWRVGLTSVGHSPGNW